jgi:hypothetical protein
MTIWVTHSKDHCNYSTQSLLSLPYPVLGSDFQQWTFPLLWVPELSPVSVTATLDFTRTAQKTLFLIVVVQLLPWVHVFFFFFAKQVVYLLISLTLPSNGPTCHSTMEQTMNVNFCVKLQKSPSKTLGMLKTADGIHPDQRSHQCHCPRSKQCSASSTSRVLSTLNLYAQTFYVEVFKRLIDVMRHKQGEMWRDSHWFFTTTTCQAILHFEHRSF